MDLWTAISSPIFKIAESNPLFIFTGSLTLVSIANLIVIIILMYKLRTTISLWGLYLFCLATLLISFGHIIGTITNVASTNDYHADPEGTVTRLNETSSAEKLSVYGIIVGFVIIMPAFVSSLAFMFTMLLYHGRGYEREQMVMELDAELKKCRNIMKKLTN